MIEAATLIKQARRAAGLTQAELAERLATTQSAVARLESPRSNPRLDTVVRALAATGHEVEATIRPAPPPVDETMIAANLRHEPRERLRQFATAYRNVSAMVREARPADGP